MNISRMLMMVCAALTIISTSNALEVTANSEGVDTSLDQLGAKVDAADAALMAVINKMLKCNNKGMVFASASQAGKDADGCVSASNGTPIADNGRCSVMSVTVRYAWNYCPAGQVLTAIRMTGVATGAKTWAGDFLCCPMKMQ